MQSEASSIIPPFLYLNVPNHNAISARLAHYVVAHTDLLASQPWCTFSEVEVSHVLQHVPLLKDFCQQKMLDPVFMAVIIVAPDLKDHLGIHVDSEYPWVRILWPVYNCVGSLTKLYHGVENTYDQVRNRSIASVPYYMVKKDAVVQQIDSFELKQPVVFDAGTPHSIYRAANSHGPRISFTMGFDRNLEISKSIQAWSNF
jgi:hypothetical protein